MEFFCYHRDRPGSAVLRDELLQEHWSYMDRYATELIARGPTFTDDDTPTGSVHVVDLPDPAAAHAFAFDEPYYQAGVYRDVLVRRWRNMLGRSMWEFPSAAVRRRLGVAGYRRPRPGTQPGRGTGGPDPRPVCGDRGAQLGLRWAALTTVHPA
jgi:uncharacterized protein YciI